MCATFKASLKEVNKSNDNCSTVLYKMTFNVFSHYMPTKKSNNSGGYLYATGYGGVQSAPTNLYRVSVKTMKG